MTYFLSDAHIGSLAMGGADERLAHQMKVVQTLQKMGEDADAIYILGDLFDFWHEYFWNDTSKEAFLPILTTLKAITSRGIPVHFFIGNHDMWTYGDLARRTGMIIHQEPVYMEVEGYRIYMAHGDGLVPSNYLQTMPKAIQRKIKNFMFLRAFFHHPIPRSFYRLLPPRWGNKFGYNWAKHSRIKELANPYPYKGENQEELVGYANELDRNEATRADFYIFGHRHIVLDLELASRARVVILGDMFRQYTYARFDQGTLQIEYLE